MCGRLSHAPYWGPGQQPRHMPWLGIKLLPLASQALSQSTEPHQPGQPPYFYFSNFEHLGSRACLLFIFTWMSNRHLKINISNSEYLLFSPKMIPPKAVLLSVDGNLIFPVALMKNLGATPHVQFISKFCWLSLQNTSKTCPAQVVQLVGA